MKSIGACRNVTTKPEDRNAKWYQLLGCYKLKIFCYQGSVTSTIYKCGALGQFSAEGLEQHMGEKNFGRPVLRELCLRNWYFPVFSATESHWDRQDSWNHQKSYNIHVDIFYIAPEIPEILNKFPENLYIVPENLNIVPENLYIVPENLNIVPENLYIVPDRGGCGTDKQATAPPNLYNIK